MSTRIKIPKLRVPKGWRKLKRGEMLYRSDVRVYGPSPEDRFKTRNAGCRLGEGGTSCPRGEIYIRRIANRRKKK